MTTNPLTEQQLADIDAREKAATAGPWCTDSWEIYQGTEYQPGISQWIGETCRGTSSPEQDRADAEFVAHARADVPALLAEVGRLKEQRKFLLTVLAKRDAEPGRADEAVRQFLAEEQPAVEESEACGKCKQPFDPADTRFDGNARYQLTPYCRSCVDRCHDTEIADHRCVICA